MTRPVEVPREDVPLVARAAAAQAIAALPAFSTPEEMADAALDAAWPLAPRAGSRNITDTEIEVVRRLLLEYRCTWPETAVLMACSVDRIAKICKNGGIRTGLAGRKSQNRPGPTAEGLAELVAAARAELRR